MASIPAVTGRTDGSRSLMPYSGDAHTLNAGSLQRLSDQQLVTEVARLAGCERAATAELVAHLAEFDRRKLYLGAGFSSLFAYCTEVLRLSEAEAYNRIEAARAARRFPVLLVRLREGALTLTTIKLLSPHLDTGNSAALIAEASGRSKQEVEQLVARHFPQPPVPDCVRKLPAPGRVTLTEADNLSSLAHQPNAAPAVSSVTAPAVSAAFSPAAAFSTTPAQPTASALSRAAVVPLASDVYKITFSASAATRNKLRRAQDLLRHQVPDGNLAEIFDRALSVLVSQLEGKKLAARKRPRTATDRPIGTRTSAASQADSPAGSRHVPAAVRRAVWMRDGGRCAFVSRDGHRCEARGFLEFHHLSPYAAGGEASVANLALRCRAHNEYEAAVYYDPLRPGAPIATRSGTSSAPAPCVQSPG